MQHLPIKTIKVTRDRFREDLGDIKELKESLSQFGQLVPVIVDDNDELLDGFRRLTAAQELGWTEVAFVRHAEVHELLAREIELETNIQRKGMTWQETDAAVVEIDRLRRARDPNWTNAQTAAIAGVSDAAAVSRAKRRVEAIKLFPDIAKAENPAQALRLADAKAKAVLRVHEVASRPADYGAIEDRIHLGDSVELIKEIPADSFHAIITDPPFGVDYDDRISGTIGEATAYEDTTALYEHILSMIPDLHRVLRPDGWLVWFLGISWYHEVKQRMRAAGFTVDECPIVWDRSDGRTYTNRPEYLYPKAYDIALHCRKGSAVFARRPSANVLRVRPVDTHERQALVERPVELYQQLIQTHTIPGETVADFFVGSGSCPAAAASLGRRYFGVELNPERRAIAIQKIKAHTPTER